ncbi:MAG: enoyl-CoA hydratase/isomerase family protein [Phycisphaeraceae bacterium]|nr:MAG: enoyl-CoA hydratase/isomerase family protein [Phycisphaeraceae bacterium]
MNQVSELATIDRDGAVARLTLNRPDARNALSLDLLAALRARVAELAKTPDVTVCVIEGAGKAFCAGMDLRAVLDEPGAPEKLLSEIAELTLELRALPMTTVAKVRGGAIGGGCGLMCVCDISITHPEAKIGFPEVDLGVCPAVVAPWLALRVGHGQARRILLEGGTMTGRRAAEIGLVSTVVEEGELDTRAQALSERLAGAGPEALRATKTWLNKLESGPDGGDLAEMVRSGARLSASVVTSEEARTRLRQMFAGSGPR